jgi:hypothetical protein
LRCHTKNSEFLILGWVDDWFHGEKINFIVYKKIKNKRTRLKARERCSLFQPNTIYLAPIVEKKYLRIFSISILVSSVWELYIFIQNIIMFIFRLLFKRRERKISGKKKERVIDYPCPGNNKIAHCASKFHLIRWVLLMFFCCWEKVDRQRDDFFSVWFCIFRLIFLKKWVEIFFIDILRVFCG